MPYLRHRHIDVIVFILLEWCSFSSATIGTQGVEPGTIPSDHIAPWVYTQQWSPNAAAAAVLHEVPQFYEPDGTLKPGKTAIRLLVARASDTTMARLEPILRQALAEINNSSSLLPDHVIELYLHRSECRPDAAVQSSLQLIYNNGAGYFHTEYGPYCSEAVGAVNDMLRVFNMFQVAPFTRGAQLSNSNRYPYLCRTSPSLQFAAEGLVRLFQVFGLTKISTLRDTKANSHSIVNDLTTAILAANADGGYGFDEDYLMANMYTIDGNRDVESVVSTMKGRHVRNIAVALYRDRGVRFYCEMYKQGYWGQNVLSFLLLGWWGERWVTEGIASIPNPQCRAEEVFTAAQHMISINQMLFVDARSRSHGITGVGLADIEATYLDACSDGESEGCHAEFGYEYDSLALLAKVFHIWLYEQNHSLSEIDYSNPAPQQQLLDIAKHIQFFGCTGAVEFFNNDKLECERKGAFTIGQFMNLAHTEGEKGWNTVGSFMSGGGFSLPDLIPWGTFQWPDGSETYLGNGSGFATVAKGVPCSFGSGSYGLENIPQDYLICDGGQVFDEVNFRCQLYCNGSLVPSADSCIEVGEPCTRGGHTWRLDVAREEAVCVCPSGSLEVAGLCRDSLLVGLVSTFVVVAFIVSVFAVCFRCWKVSREDAAWIVDLAALNFRDTPEVLGEGSLGQVVKAEYCGAPVAVKRVALATLEVSHDGYRHGGFVYQHGSETDHLHQRASARQNTGSSDSGDLSVQHAEQLEEGSFGGRTPGIWPSRCVSEATRTPVTWTASPDFSPKGPSSSRCSPVWVKRATSIRRRRQALLREMRQLAKLRHPCILQVIGAVPSTEPMLVIMEWMEYGSLQKLLQNETVPLEGSMVLPILQDVAQGMRYLHALTPFVVHGALKASHVLVDAKFRAKVSHIGFSPKGPCRSTSERLWHPPELLRGGHYSTESDVYAFGVLICEVYSRKEPYAGEDRRKVLQAVADLEQQKRPTIPIKTCPSEMAELMKECWMEKPELRPAFSKLERRLQSMDIERADPLCVSRSMQVCKEERARRADALLNNVFPMHVKEALRDQQKVQPEAKELVTIFFSDIVGFTKIANRLAPQKVSSLLDRLYSKFDELCDRHGVFKVETIGDAYMAVTNLVEDQSNSHAKRIAEFAFDVIAAANETPIDLEDLSMGRVNIRVGFHSGPVVASVVGTRSPRYCLFGDTVNTASRMESNSRENCVHCSSEAANWIRLQAPDLLLDPRGTIHVKGKGDMTTFWVKLAEGVMVSSSKAVSGM